MKNIILVSIVLMLISTVAYAQNYTCLDADTSQFSTTIIVSGESIPIQYNETCKFECNTETGRCNPSPFDVNIMDATIMFSMFLMAVIFFILSWKTESDAYRNFYFFGGLLFLLAYLLMTITYIDIINKTGKLGYVEDMLWWILIPYAFSIIILLILIFADLWKLLGEKKIFQRLGI